MATKIQIVYTDNPKEKIDVIRFAKIGFDPLHIIEWMAMNQNARVRFCESANTEITDDMTMIFKHRDPQQQSAYLESCLQYLNDNSIND